MATNPTVVVGHLNDQELKNNINALVQHVNEGMNKIVQSTNTAVENIKNKLKELGNINVNEPSSKSSSNRVRSQKEVTEAVRETTRASRELKVTLDQQASTMQNAMRPKSAQDSYYTIVKNMRENLALLAKEIKSMPSVSLDRQFAAYMQYERQIEQVRNRIAELRQELNNIGKDPSGSRLVVRQITEEIQQSQQRIVQLEREQITATQQIAAADKRSLMAKQEQYEREKQALLDMSVGQRQRVTFAEQQATQEGRITDEIRKQAQAIRESKSWKESGFAIINGNAFYDSERMNATLQKKKEVGTLEEQILRTMRAQSEESAKQATEESRRATEAKQLEQSTRQIAENMRAYFNSSGKSEAYLGKFYTNGSGEKMVAQYLYAENDERAKGLSLEQQILNIRREHEAVEERILQKKREQGNQKTNSGNNDSLSFYQRLAQVLNVSEQQIRNTGTSTKALANQVSMLQTAWDKLSRSEKNSQFGKDLRMTLQEAKRELQLLKKEAERPISFNFVKNLPVKTIDDIAYKIQQLQNYKRGLNITDPKQVAEMQQVDNEINRLNKDLQKYMSNTKQATQLNNALSRSWNYMKNRLAFYFTVGASTQFVKNLIDIRSQYEMNERALGILINSAERGTQIFNQLSQMALVSPYTLIELSAAARQLVAYDVAARDVVDTTRRLADMASAVGVPMERLTYALGQIKAYGYLNSRDNRMFANAGIPLVKQLADYYTEFEGKLVSTADVYDRIKKKAVSYNDVMQVINKMTDEGGKFFDFQAKMADTLKVRLANLTLAWNNMLNEVGKETQGILTFGIGALKQLFLHWKDLDALIKNAAWIVGIRTAVMFLFWACLKAGNALGLMSKQMALSAVFGKRLAATLKTVGYTFATIVKTPLTWWSLLIMVIWEAGAAFLGANKAQEEFNKSIRDGAKDNYENISKFLDQYKKVRNSLYKNEKYSFVDPGGIERTRVRTVEQDIDKGEASKVWEAMREQIELTTLSSNNYIGSLLRIENMSERLRQGFIVLDSLQEVNAAIKEMDDETIRITKDLSSWWNAWALPDGLLTNLKEYKEELDKIIEKYGSLENFRKNTFLGGKGTEDINDYEQALERFRDDLKETTDSILNFINLKGWGGNETKINEAFSQIINKYAIDNQLDPQSIFVLQLEAENARSQAAKQALEARIEDEKAALKAAYSDEVAEALKADQTRLANWAKFNGESRVYWDNFTKYIKERHISELQAAYNKMTENGTVAMNYQSQEWFEFVRSWANKYEKENGYAQDSVFNRLRNWINDANNWEVFIKLTISTEDGKSVYDVLTEADTAANDAYKKIERLKRRRGELEKMGGAASSDLKVATEYRNTVEEIATAEQDYNDALAKGGHSQKEDTENKKARARAAREAAKAQREAAKAQREAETELQRALKDELSLIDKVRSQYKKLTDAGVSNTTALTMVTTQFNNSIEHINKVLGKNGLPLFDIKTFAGTDNPREILNMLKAQLEAAKLAKNIKPAEIKDLEIKYGEIVIDAKAYDTKKIADGLNNELGKIKDEYELAVELDANPELGGLFEDMLGIDMRDLPQTFGEAFDMANDIAKKKLSELKVDVRDFDLMRTVITPDENNMWEGLTFDSEFVKNLTKWQKTFRDMFQKNIADTEKMLDDFVKKYGDYSDKMAEIEANRLNEIKRLNEAYYTEEMRTRPEYLAKLNAIEAKANRERGRVKLDEFKNSSLYVAMFENLQYAATETLVAIREKLDTLKEEMGELDPQQLKSIQQQFEKINTELLRRNPYKGLIKNAKNYIKTLGKSRKIAQQDFKIAQDKYDAQLEIVTKKKEELEQIKAQEPFNTVAIGILAAQVGEEDEKLKKLKEELELANELNDKYNLMTKIFKEQANAIATDVQKIANNLQALGEFRDTLNGLFGIDASKGETLLGHNIDGIVDGLTKVGDGLNQIVSSAQSYNVVGVATGVINSVAGIGDSIASVFGDGPARTRRLNREIYKSKDAVRELNLAYKDLERAVERATGTEETSARRMEIANKEAEMAEIQRQMELERRKRSKDRDNDAIKEYEETIQDLRNEIADLKDDLVNNLLGSDVKSAAEDFVDTWVDAWRAGETTLDAITTKMDEMIYNLIKKAATSKIVSVLLDPLYKAVDRFTQTSSEGGYDLTTNELSSIAQLAGELGIKINDALGAFYGNLANLNIINKNIENGDDELSALQAGIQGITEDTAGALEAYMNSVSQQVYLQSDLLTQIRDAVVMFNTDVQVATISQILLQLQSSYQVQMSIQGILEGWSNASGQAMRVELMN